MKSLKTTIISNIKFVVLAAILAIGTSYAFATTYTDPTSTPPDNNIDVPVNVGTVSQVKVGGLSVNGFSALQNASFEQQVFLNGIIRGDDPSSPQNSSKIDIGGVDSTGILRTVNAAISGRLDVTGSIQSDSVTNSSGNSPLCADASGVIGLCSGGGGGGGGGGGDPIPSYELVPVDLCPVPFGPITTTQNVSAVSEGFLLYELRSVNGPSGATYDWEVDRNSGGALDFASSCNNNYISGNADKVSCVVYFDESINPGYNFETNDVSVDVITSSGTTTVTGTTLASVTKADYCVAR